MANAKRKDKSRVVLRTGEVQRANGTYHFCWTDKNGKRHYIYAKTLEELREKEKQVQRDKADGIKAEARYVTINDLFDLWIQIKRGVKNNTFENYKYMYNTFVRPNFGKMRIGTLKKSDVKRFYNYLADDRGLQAATIDNIHTVLHQVLDMAVDDDYIRANPSNNVLKELKRGGMVEITPGNRYRITAAGRQSISNDTPNETSDTIAAGNVSSTDRMSELLRLQRECSRGVKSLGRRAQ